MTSLYTIDVTVYYSVEVEAESQEEAEALALEQVEEYPGNWDSVDFYVAEIEEYED